MYLWDQYILEVFDAPRDLSTHGKQFLSSHDQGRHIDRPGLLHPNHSGLREDKNHQQQHRRRSSNGASTGRFFICTATLQSTCQRIAVCRGFNHIPESSAGSRALAKGHQDRYIVIKKKKRAPMRS
jgi:hypothetical protein